MKKATVRLLYLCILFLLILSACGPDDAVIEMPPDDTPVAVIVESEPGDEPEEPAEAVEADLEDKLAAGTAMKWYDDGYIVFVPSGEVTLGDSEYENNPVHSVFVDDYWIYMFKVTNGQYRHCVATGTCTLPAIEPPYPDLEDLALKDQPVIGVTWEQAETYCEWMNGKLPSKAEWEKATRGPDANTFPWGEEDPDCDLLNYGDCENPAISEVYEYPEGKSYYQAYGLAGNAYEWVFDLYEDDYISQLPGEEPAGPPEGTERSVRGSSYVSEEELIPSAQLFYLEPENYRTDLGFRCVIGEGEGGSGPKSFANPCIQTAFVPGYHAPWNPAPDPDENELPDLKEPVCNPEKELAWTYFCLDVPTQVGGLDLYITGLNGSDAYLKNYSSNGSVYCEETNVKVGCFGPESAAVSFEICASCTPIVATNSVNFGCDSCYTLSQTDPLTCVYAGSQPAPGGTCPAGYIYDLVNDICVKQVADSEECPAGYEYNPDTDCCVASFAGTDQGPGQLGNSYLVCPPGYGNVQLVGESSQQGQSFATCYYSVNPTSDIEECEVVNNALGMCEDPPPDARCTNPSSYSTQGPCEAALCKWEQGVTGGWSCVFPQ